MITPQNCPSLAWNNLDSLSFVVISSCMYYDGWLVDILFAVSLGGIKSVLCAEAGRRCRAVCIHVTQ
jgi:hypothetical protein